MADADPRAPTRKELARFLPDQRTIRAFEKLFELVPDGYNEQFEEALNAAFTANANAVQAADGIVRASERIKSNEVLLWLSTQ